MADLKKSQISEERVHPDFLITLTADIVSAHLSNNKVEVGSVSGLISNVYSSLFNITDEKPNKEILPEPAVSVRASVKRDRIACLECGKRMKMLKRHLTTEHNLTPDEYRQRWNLPSDYPMVASDYAETRRDLAKKIGLGRMPGMKRGRKKKA